MPLKLTSKVVRQNERHRIEALNPDQLAYLQSAFDDYVKARTTDINIREQEWKRFEKILLSTQEKSRKVGK
jgi:hypothetical protein